MKRGVVLVHPFMQANHHMESDYIDYSALMQQAILGMVRNLLRDTAEKGLVGDHHFYIAFDTTHPDVQIPQHLRERHPKEMTIVLQHQFWDLFVSEEIFSLRLSFNGKAENLVVPFDALTGFMDPSVQFGLQLKDQGDAAVPELTIDPEQTASAPVGDELEPLDEGTKDEADEGPKDNVIALDAFRNQ